MNSREPSLEWLIKSRIKTQRFLLKLSGWMNSKRCKNLLEDTELKHFRLVHGLLLGTAFALWRACFLINNSDNEHNEEDNKKNNNVQRVTNDQLRFLNHLARNNAIGYPQDRNSQLWTSRYYLNDALYRNETLHIALQKILKQEKSFSEEDKNKFKEIDEYAKKLQVDHNGFLGFNTENEANNSKNLGDVWEESMEVLEKHYGFVKRHYRKIAKSKE